MKKKFLSTAIPNIWYNKFIKESQLFDSYHVYQNNKFIDSVKAYKTTNKNYSRLPKKSKKPDSKVSKESQKYLTAENYKIGDIAKLFLSGLNIAPAYNGYKALDQVKKSVTKMQAEKNQKPVLIIDEAQQLPLSNNLLMSYAFHFFVLTAG